MTLERDRCSLLALFHIIDTHLKVKTSRSISKWLVKGTEVRAAELALPNFSVNGIRDLAFVTLKRYQLVEK